MQIIFFYLEKKAADRYSFSSFSLHALQMKQRICLHDHKSFRDFVERQHCIRVSRDHPHQISVLKFGAAFIFYNENLT